MDNSAVDKLIRESLKQPYDWPIPDHYRKPFILHAADFPDEKSFWINLDERALRCYKGQCYEVVPLAWLPELEMVSLANYAEHLNTPNAIRQHALPRNPPPSTQQNQASTDEDVKPDITAQSDNPAPSPSTTRPLATSPVTQDKFNSPVPVNHQPAPDFSEQELELSNLDLKQARIESQISQLKADNPPFKRNNDFHNRLSYFEVTLKNINKERVQLRAIIGRTKAVLDLADDDDDDDDEAEEGDKEPKLTAQHGPGPMAVAGPGPRTLEGRGADSSLAEAAAVAKALDVEEAIAASLTEEARPQASTGPGPTEGLNQFIHDDSPDDNGTPLGYYRSPSEVAEDEPQDKINAIEAKLKELSADQVEIATNQDKNANRKVKLRRQELENRKQIKQSKSELTRLQNQQTRMREKKETAKKGKGRGGDGKGKAKAKKRARESSDEWTD